MALLVSSLVCYQNNKKVLPFTLFSIYGNATFFMGKLLLGSSLYSTFMQLHVAIGELVLLAMAVSSYVPILLAVLMYAGCQEHVIYSNITENSMKDVGQNELMRTFRTGPLQQCLNDEQKSSVARMDPTDLDDGDVSCPAWSVKHNGEIFVFRGISEA